MSNHEPLRDALRHRADQIGDTSPLTLDDVKGRARGIRRRRAAVTGLAAAAVLAVAVPMGIAVTDGVGEDPENPPVAGPSTTPSEDGPAPDTGVKDGVLTTDVDAESYAPAIPFLYDGRVTLPDGETIALQGEWDELVPLGESSFVVADAGRQELQVVGSDESPSEGVAEGPATGGSAGSVNPSVAARPIGTATARTAATASPETAARRRRMPVALPLTSSRVSGLVSPSWSARRCSACRSGSWLLIAPPGRRGWCRRHGSATRRAPGSSGT